MSRINFIYLFMPLFYLKSTDEDASKLVGGSHVIFFIRTDIS